jgi:hypothetical protein
MSDDIPKLPDYAAELEAELTFGPRKYEPEEGIRVMEARIKGLLAELANLDHENLAAGRCRILPQLQDARDRLAQYRDRNQVVY